MRPASSVLTHTAADSFPADHHFCQLAGICFRGFYGTNNFAQAHDGGEIRNCQYFTQFVADKKNRFSLLCQSFGQLGELVIVDNKAYRTIKALTPGAYTFILPATKEVPRMTLNKKKKTVGVRLPDHKVTQAIVEELGAPLLCSTLIMPGEDEPLTDAEEVAARIGNEVDLVVDAPVGLAGATTVIDFIPGYPEVVREGAGDTSLFA